MQKGKKRAAPLTETHPELLAEWHQTLNDISPGKVTAFSRVKVWWQCLFEKEHVWQQSITSRAIRGTRCPDCKRKENCLATRHPDIAKQWHPSLNGTLRPEDVHAGSETKVWWQCPVKLEHVYETMVYSRTGAGSGCHFCSGHKLDPSNSLQMKFPELAAELHPTMNGGLKAIDVSYGSKLDAWWMCRRDKTHEWPEPVYHRTQHQSECPYCSGYYLTDENRFSTCHPEIAAEFHPTKNRKLWPELQGSWRPNQNRRVPPKARETNRKLRPSDLSVNSHEYVWWKCRARDHVWQAVVADRVRYQSGCPICTNQKVGEDNNLAVLEPALAKLWHPSRNLPLGPTDVVPGSAEVVWWRCSKSADHIWQAPVYRAHRQRQNGKHYCPFCHGRRVCASNCLASVCPAAAAMWHPDKNAKSPDQVTSKSPLRVWWKCAKGHEFKSSIADVVEAVQARGTNGCRFCSGRVATAEDNLEVRYPVIAKLWWHHTLNLPLRAKDVKHGSRKKAWWGCQKSREHKWEAPICTVVQYYRRGHLSCLQCNRKLH